LWPQHDVTPRVDVNYASLRTLTAYQVVNGFAVVPDYQALIDVEWNGTTLAGAWRQKPAGFPWRRGHPPSRSSAGSSQTQQRRRRQTTSTGSFRDPLRQ
jgi:hypothetical protein